MSMLLKNIGTTHRREPVEHWEQVQFVTLFRLKYPNIRIFAIPNGGYRSLSVGKKLKAEGVVSGVPDLFIPEWRLFIEMKKRHGGRLSREQINWLNYLSSIGYKVAVCRGCDEAMAVADEIATLLKKEKSNGEHSDTAT